MKKSRNLADLKIIFENDESPRATLALKLIAEAQFMESVLKKLKTAIKKSDVISVFEQGSQKFDRENQSLKSYNTTIKNYQSVIKTLNDIVPAKYDAIDENEFEL